jgi:hypothetical protein
MHENMFFDFDWSASIFWSDALPDTTNDSFCGCPGPTTYKPNALSTEPRLLFIYAYGRLFIIAIPHIENVVLLVWSDVPTNPRDL